MYINFVTLSKGQMMTLRKLSSWGYCLVKESYSRILSNKGTHGQLFVAGICCLFSQRADAQNADNYISELIDFKIFLSLVRDILLFRFLETKA